MTSRRSGLGRNLNALLGDKLLAIAEPNSQVEVDQQTALRTLPVEYLQPGNCQPRTNMTPQGLQELSDSIKTQGIIQPIIVRPLADKHYEIIAGERRWRAAKLAGLADVPIIVRQASDKTAVALALIENIQREDLNPIEQARALARLIEEFELTHKQVAETVGKSRAAVSNLLRLISLHPDVITLLEKQQLDMGHARALLSLDKAEQQRIAQHVVDKQLTVRQTEQLVRRHQQGLPVAPSSKPTLSPALTQIQTTLSNKFGTKVSIQPKTHDKGKLTIQYQSLADLNRLLEKI